MTETTAPKPRPSGEVLERLVSSAEYAFQKNDWRYSGSWPSMVRLAEMVLGLLEVLEEEPGKVPYSIESGRFKVERLVEDGVTQTRISLVLWEQWDTGGGDDD